MTKIVIIGSRGFIGSFLCRYLRGRGHEVTECDILPSSIEDFFLVDKHNTEYTALFENKKYDICINCSGAASVQDSFDRTLRDFDLNVTNVIKILEAIRKYQPTCRMINLSSAAVYGNPEHLPIQERHSTNPISPYGHHKLLAEKILKEYSELHDIKTTNLRIFSAYGEGLKKQLLWDLSQKMKQSSSIQLFGSGNETRDFIHIHDLSVIIELVCLSDSDEPIMNVANGKQVSIKHVSELFAQALNWNGEIHFTGDTKIGDPAFWEAEISKTKSLGYNQSITLENGLERYVKWLKKSL